ncbi:MAG: c-type cytochrome [Burkholderiales bacterium]|nr:c-type cytochrome [Burkholderiales bacterium]
MRFLVYWLSSAATWHPRVRGVLLCASAAVAGLLTQALVQACSDVMEPTGTDTHFPMVYGDRPTVAQLTDLGRRMFSDTGLSASGKLSCASCHDPKAAYGPPTRRLLQPGGLAMDRTGFRNTPSLRYLHSPVAFTEHFYEVEATGGKDDQGPTGGRTWDGRVNTGHDQALMPLMDANEMANPGKEAIAARLAKSAYANAFAEAVSPPGENIFDDPDSAVLWMTVAIETFEQSRADFHPFTSKFDSYLRDEVDLTPAEKRGMALFNDMKKGNCASCHPSTHKQAGVRFPAFTDLGHVALAVPRNKDLAANQDPEFFDLGLCGPLRTDLRDRPEYCGLFRTPTLRNVALRHHFFHNGALHSLRDVVEFYATRDTNPRKWYPMGADHQVQKYNDLPRQYWTNVNADIPFKPLPDGRARLNPREINDIVAFLGTLSDGFLPPKAASAPAPARPAARAGGACRRS